MPELMTPTSPILPCHMPTISGFRHGENPYRKSCLRWGWGLWLDELRRCQLQSVGLQTRQVPARQQKKKTVLTVCCQCFPNGVGHGHNNQPDIADLGTVSGGKCKQQEFPPSLHCSQDSIKRSRGKWASWQQEVTASLMCSSFRCCSHWAVLYKLYTPNLHVSSYLFVYH